VADLSDHVEKLIGAWKALLPVVAVIAGGAFWFATTLYEREIATLKTERDGLRAESSDIKARLKAAAPPPVAEDEGPIVWFSNIMMEGGPLQGRNVFTLQFPSMNKSHDAVAIKSAEIVSGIDGIVQPLEIVADNEIVALSSVGRIPAGARVVLVAKFGPPDPNAPGKILGLDPKVFADRWRQFSFKVEDEKRKYQLPFSEAFMATFLPNLVGPRVTKKDEKQ
jgi:hypothetical protein